MEHKNHFIIYLGRKNAHWLWFLFTLCLSVYPPIFFSAVYGQGGPGGVGNINGQNDQPLLNAWYNAANVNQSGQQVLQLNDLSGNAHHAIPPNPSFKPEIVSSALFDQPVIRFEENHLLEIPAMPFNPAGFTFMGVHQSNHPENEKGTLLQALVWAGDWPYRKKINLRGQTGAGTNYQVKLTVGQNEHAANAHFHVNGHSVNFPHDIRFTADDGETFIPYWVEEVNGTHSEQTATFWVNVPANLDTNQSIYIYYGNDNAGTASNPFDTFLFYDDFNRPDVSDITEENAYRQTNLGTWSIINNQLRNVGANGDPNKLILDQLGQIDHPVVMKTRIKIEALGSNDFSRIGLSACMESNGEGYNVLFRNHNGRFSFLNDLRSWGSQLNENWNLEQWYYFEFLVTDPASREGKARFWEIAANTPDWLEMNFGNGAARDWGYIGFAGSRASDITWFDDIMVRKYNDPEPGFLSNEPEETIASAVDNKIFYQFSGTHLQLSMLIEGNTEQVNANGKSGFFINGLFASPQGATLFVDGNMAGETAYSYPGMEGAAQLNTGLNGQGGSMGLKGDMAEMIFFNKTINEAQRIILENYLATKYNLDLEENKIYSHSTHTRDLTGIGVTDADNRHTRTSGCGGGLYMAQANNSFEGLTNAFLMAAHNGATHGTTSEGIDPDAGVSQRWQRTWYLQKTEHVSFDISLGFHFGEAAQTLESDKIYVVLFREDETNLFTPIPGTMATGDEDMVWLDISEENLQNGYYTIAPLENTVWYAYPDGIYDNSGYWDQPGSWTVSPDGDYDNPEALTPDTSPTSHHDLVVIPQGKRVTVRENNYQNPVLDVREGVLDFLDTQGHEFSSILGKGTIRLKADNFPGGNASEFVAENGGTVAYYGTDDITLTNDRLFNNMLVDMSSTAQTVVLLADYTLNGTLTIKRGELKLNNDIHPNPVADIRKTLIIKKDWLIETDGSFTIGKANTNNEALQLGNGGGPYLLAGNNGIGTESRLPSPNNYHLIYHQIEVWGNFTNRGSALFTNQPQPIYNQLNGYAGTTNESTGSAVVSFKGTADNLIDLYGTTDFYHLIIDKGSNPDPMLTIRSQDEAHFRLFGNNILNGTGSGANPELRKALWIKNGTLHLQNNVHIPTLTEGRIGGSNPNADFYIPANAGLWVDGAIVYGTADNESETEVGGLTGVMVDDYGLNSSFQGNIQSTSFYGNFLITDGIYSTRRSGGLIVWAEGDPYVKIEGGTLDAAQFRSAGNTDDNNRITFHQTGGLVNIRGNINGTAMQGTKGSFSILGEHNVFIMEGGELRIWDGIGSGGVLEIDVSQANIGVTGGTVHLIMDKDLGQGFRDNFFVNTVAPVHNLKLSTIGAAQPENIQPIHLYNNLIVRNNILIGDDIQFYAARNLSDGPFYDLEVQGDFALGESNSSNAGYHPTSNDGSIGNKTIFSGVSNSQIRIANTDISSQVTFHTLIINKLGQDTLQVISEGREPADIHNHDNQYSILAINQGMKLLNGLLDYNGFMIQLDADVELINNNAIGLLEDETGYIAFDFPTLEVTLTQQKEAVFGRMFVADNLTFTGGNHFRTGDLYLRSGVIDISKAGLIIEGKLVNEKETSIDFGPGKMVLTAGNHSDNGLTRRVFQNDPYLFPLGVNTQTGDGHKYTPAIIDVSETKGQNGWVKVNNVDQELATLMEGTEEEHALQYYWRVRHQGFDSEDMPMVKKTFRFFDIPGTYLPDPTTHDYTEGKVVNYIRHQNLGGLDWNAANQDLTLNFIYQNTGDTDVPAHLEEGAFTAAHPNRFDGHIEVFFSRLRGSETDQSLWGETSSWTTLSQLQEQHPETTIMNNPGLWHHSDNPEATDLPGKGDIVIIGYSTWDDQQFPGHPHNIRIDEDFQAHCAELQFNPMLNQEGESQPITESTTWGNGFFYRPTFTITDNASLNTSIITGEGTLRNRGIDPLYTSMDMGGFVKMPLSFIMYEIMEDVTIENTPEVIPNLSIIPDGWGSNNHSITFPADITVNYNLEILGGAYLRMHPGEVGNIHIKGDLRLMKAQDNSGTQLLFENSGSPRTLTVEGNLVTEGEQVGIYVDSPADNGTQHVLNLYGNYIQDATGAFDEGEEILRLFTQPGEGRVSLHLRGDSHSFFDGSNTTTPISLYRLEVDKAPGSMARMQIPFTLGGSKDGNDKALVLKNGRLVLDHENIQIHLTTGGGDFPIPPSAALIVSKGTILASGNNTGIFLNGLLRLENNGEARFFSGNDDTYIHYSASGNARLEIADNAKLWVGSQIRGDITGSQTTGILKYHQSGGEVIVGRNHVPANSRGVFEVFNPGSEFIMDSGNLYIARNQQGNDREALYLNPGTVSMGLNAFIHAGHNEYSPSGQLIEFNSHVAFANLRTAGEGITLQASNNPFVVENEMYVSPGTTVDLNQLQLTIMGDFYNLGNNPDINAKLTLFAGMDQQLNGETHFEHLVINPSIQLTLYDDIHISGDFALQTGALHNQSQSIYVQGNVINNTTIQGSATHGGMVLNGGTLQQISGNGSYGRLMINNAGGVRLYNDIQVNGNLAIQSGLLDIQNHRLSLGQESQLEGESFSSTKMVSTSGGIEAFGLQKHLEGGSENYTFRFPVGSGGKYTPVDIEYTHEGSNGHISFAPINEQHITTLDYNENRVLQYHWAAESHNLVYFEGDIFFYFDPADLETGNPEQYIPARLTDESWTKLGEEDFEQDQSRFRFIHPTTQDVSGYYTAGYEEDIPDNVPTYRTNNSGAWTNKDIWEKASEDLPDVPESGPFGHIVEIMESHEVTIENNRRRSFITRIMGSLHIGATEQHNLGLVEGNGTITLDRGLLPAGKFNTFFNTPGSTIKYGGAQNYQITNRYTTLQNLVIRGSEEKKLPDESVTIKGNLTIEGTALLRNYDELYIHGDLGKAQDATFYTGKALLFSGTTPQTLTGNFTDASIMNNVVFNNHSGQINFLDGHKKIGSTIGLLNGTRLITSMDARLKLAANSTFMNLDDQSYVDGPMSRIVIHNESSSLFPVGKNKITRYFYLINPQHSQGYKEYTVEYFNADPTAEFGDEFQYPPLYSLSEWEYWTLHVPPGAQQTRIMLTYGNNTNIDDEAAGFEENIAIAHLEDIWRPVGTEPYQYKVDTQNKTVASTSSVNLTSKNPEKLFTFGSKSPQMPLPVKLLFFHATAEENDIKLEWATASETNNDFFTIERSRNGTLFEKVIDLPSQTISGHSHETLHYTSRDNKPLEGVSYYRLKQTDFDGSTTYSDLVGISFQKRTEVRFTLYPNPNPGNHFNILLSGLKPQENTTLRITDLYGRTFYGSLKTADEAGTIQSTMNTGGKLKPGVYLITVSGQSGIFTARLVIK